MRGCVVRGLLRGAGGAVVKARTQTGSGVRGARRTVIVGVRVTRPERAQLRKEAARRGVSLSVYLRAAILGPEVP